MNDARSTVERRIAQYVRAVLPLSDTTTDVDLVRSDLFDLGLTSKSALVLMAWLEAEFGLRVSLRDVFADPYVTALAELVRTADGAPAV